MFDLEWRDRGLDAGETARENRVIAAHQRVFAAEASTMVHGLISLGIGGVIAVPTDTLYGEGLISDAQSCHLGLLKQRLQFSQPDHDGPCSPH